MTIAGRFELRNRLGLHARAAAKFVHLASSFPCDVNLEFEGRSVDAKSILGLLLVAAPFGSIVSVMCDGENEEEALATLGRLINDRFGEDE